MRTVNSLRNASASLLYLAVKTALEFVLRTIFIQTLGTTYLGVNGLFSNILMILNLAELGVGNAIIFNLYKPVAEKNMPRIKSLMLLYRKCYSVIGIGIFLAGLCLMPFLDSMIKYDAQSISHIKFIFLLYLINTSSSYFMVYKTNLINVHEKHYIVNIIKMIFEVSLVVIQIIVLLVFKNYYLYLFILIANTIVSNLICSIYAQKMYPEELFLKNADKLPKDEKKSIFKDVYALMMYKIGGVITNGTGNILISSFVGLSAVGIYSNYVLIVNAVKMLLTNVFNSVTASVGNLNAMGDTNKSVKMFYQMTFIAFYLYGLSSVCMWSAFQPFIKLWLGKKYLLSVPSVIFIILYFYLIGIHSVSLMFRNTTGIFVKGKYRPLISALLNIVMAIFLAKSYGITGVLAAAPLACILTTVWYDPKLVLNHAFGVSVSTYYIKYVGYFATCLISCASVSLAFYYLNTSNILHEVILRLFTGFLIFNLIIIVAYRKSDEFSSTIAIFKVLKNKLRGSR